MYLNSEGQIEMDLYSLYKSFFNFSIWFTFHIWFVWASVVNHIMQLTNITALKFWNFQNRNIAIILNKCQHITHSLLDFRVKRGTKMAHNSHLAILQSFGKFHIYVSQKFYIWQKN
jgi:hypothetical protein